MPVLQKMYDIAKFPVNIAGGQDLERSYSELRITFIQANDALQSAEVLCRDFCVYFFVDI